MIKLICVNCGNYTYFETDVQGIRSVAPTAEGMIIKDSFIEGSNYTDETIRGSMIDIIDYVLKQSEQILQFDPETNKYHNQYIACARCGSKVVTPPYSEWKPTPDFLPLDDELLENSKEFLQLRKERRDDNNLPILWEP